MEAVTRALLTPVFVFNQATLGEAWLAVLVLIAVAGLGFIVWRRASRRATYWVVAMPVPWLLMATGAGWNWAQPGVHGVASAALTFMVQIQWVATLSLSGIAIGKAKSKAGHPSSWSARR